MKQILKYTLASFLLVSVASGGTAVINPNTGKTVTTPGQHCGPAEACPQ
ncbi:MAG: hypothetical protein P8L77_05825 [Gammaproteobacteria bacterium]|nr:hypothetical protein [Gammaproteobacteria bacterium]